MARTESTGTVVGAAWDQAASLLPTYGGWSILGVEMLAPRKGKGVRWRAMASSAEDIALSRRTIMAEAPTPYEALLALGDSLARQGTKH